MIKTVLIVLNSQIFVANASMGSNHKITNVYANKEIMRQLMALIAFPANLDAKNVLTLTNVINVEVDI